MALLRWAAAHSEFMLDARRSAWYYTLHFGAYKGCTLSQLVRSSQCGGRSLLLPDAPDSTPQPGDYLLWLASRAFTWRYPYHVYLYLALWRLDDSGCAVWSERAGGMVSLVVCDAAREHSAAYFRSVEAHRAAVRTTLLLHKRPDCLLSCLPKEVLLQVLLPQLPLDAFSPLSIR